MTAIIEILRSLYGLFVDDELLAIGVLGVVALAALLIKIVGMEPLAAGAGLLCGTLLVLIVGAMRTARRTGRS